MDRIFHGYKVRYELLNQYLLPVRASRNIHTMNIFINLDDFFHKLHKPITENEFQTTGKDAYKWFTSNLLNLAGHYKNWLIKEHMNGKVFLYYTSAKVFRNTAHIDTYRKHYNEINRDNLSYFHINNTIQNTLRVLQSMCKYIPNIYAIDTSYIEPSILPYYINNIIPANYNLIISRDEYDIQYTLYENFGVMIPKGDNSHLLTKGNLWKYILKKNEVDLDVYFTPELYLYAKCIIGDKYRGIPKLTRVGWKSIVKYFKEIDERDDYIKLVEIQKRKITEFINSKKIDDTDFNTNMKCTSVELQTELLLDIAKSMIDTQIMDYNDTKSLLELNQSIFTGHPFNLAFLLKTAPSSFDKPTDEYKWRKEYKKWRVDI